MEQPLLVYTTFPDADAALAIREEFVRAKLYACVNVFPGMRSVYTWQGNIEQCNEVVAILKTKRHLGGALTVKLKARYTYETPFIISLAASDMDFDKCLDRGRDCIVDNR